MKMLNELAVFAQVVESASFSTAARQLNLTTSAVSRHVTRLEEQLGGRLLFRTTRSLKLTELGERVYEGCARMMTTVREIHTLAGSYSARPNGVVRVTAPVVLGQVWLAPRITSFLELYPDVSVHLTLVDRQVDLVEDGMDLAIRIARELHPGLAARPVRAMHYMLVASHAYLAKHGHPQNPLELAAHQCIYLGYSSFGDKWTLLPKAGKSVLEKPQRGSASDHSAASSESVQVKIAGRAMVNNSTAIMAMVESNGGIGLVPDFSAQAALAQGTVQEVLPGWTLGEPYTGTVYAVYNPGPHLPLKTRTLIDHLVDF